MSLGRWDGHLANAPKALVIRKCEKLKHVRVHYRNSFHSKHTRARKTKFGTPRRPSQLNTNPVLGRTISTILSTDKDTISCHTCAPPSSIDPMETNTMSTMSFNNSVGYSPGSRTSAFPASPSQTTSAPAHGLSIPAGSQTLSLSSGSSCSTQWAVGAESPSRSCSSLGLVLLLTNHPPTRPTRHPLSRT